MPSTAAEPIQVGALTVRFYVDAGESEGQCERLRVRCPR
jgi:hypothetical protein